MKSISVYVHVPFCRSKCLYCDFVSHSGLELLFSPYAVAVADEARQFFTEYPGLCCQTVYFGGGTPSLLGVEQFESMLAAMPSIDACAEITVEANPRTVDLVFLRGLRALGVNRLSLGLQSNDDELLRRLGRRHSAADALGAYRIARQAGFENISVDLMFGLPGQTLDGWRDTLGKAVDLKAEHLSLYGLTIEVGTPFASLRCEGRLDVPDEDMQADMFLLAEDVLDRAGYERYEISNWARRGPVTLRARHNLVYWRNEPYVGLGAAAHSNWAGCRSANTSDVREYIAAVSEGRSPRASQDVVDSAQEMAETMMLGLRLAEGIGERDFEARFGCGVRDAYGDTIDELVGSGLLVATEDRLSLSSRGVLLGNEVFSRFVCR